MTTPLLAVPKFRAFDAAGNPLSSGLVYTYAAGTTTPKATYSDAAGSTPNANPVVLDINGEATIRLGSGGYKFVLQDSLAATQWTIDDVYPPVTDQASIGLVLYPQTTAESAAGVTPTNYYYPSGVDIDCRRYGQVGDGSTDDSTAIANACLVAAQLGRAIIRLYGTPKLVTGISVPSATVIQGSGREATTVTKAGNIDMFTLAAGAELRGLALAGVGGTYTGRGVVISSGNHQKITDCEILDMSGYCVEYTAATIGTYSHIERCHLGRTTTSNAAIRLPDDGGTASPRYITTCTTVAFQILVDCNIAQNTLIRGCYFNNMTFGTSKKTIVVGNRIATTGGTLDITGDDNVVVGNAIAGAPTIGSGSSRNVVQGNVSVNPCVDNSGSTGTNANWVDIPFTSYTCSWTGSVSNPAIGNGTLTAYYQRTGRQVRCLIKLLIGSTTTMGSGTWRFSVPYTIEAGPVMEGSLRILDSGTAFLIGNAVTNPTTTYVTAYSHNTASEVTPTVPITFTTNDTIWIDITFEV